MDIRKIHTYELKNAGYNPRKDLRPNDPEYKKLKRSIKEFGYVEPIIVNKDMTVIGGHQRLKVLNDLGYVEVECIVLDLPKDKEKALNVALNKISGDWDKDKLRQVFLDLQLDEYDLELTGFDVGEIDKLLDEGIKEDKGEVEFSEELMEEHNYVVLYFDNTLDWQVAKEVFEIKTVKTKEDTESYNRKGVGRVIRGDKVLKMLGSI
jgi:ParB-like chromosome segregation protein Spo0J